MQLPVVRKEILEQDRNSAVEHSIARIIEMMEMPTMNDLEAASQAVVRIQFAYRLDPVEMAGGRIRGVQTEGRLSGRQMMMIAESRMSGVQPLRPGLGREYAIA